MQTMISSPYGELIIVCVRQGANPLITPKRQYFSAEKYKGIN